VDLMELPSPLQLTLEFTGSNGEHLWTTSAKTKDSLNVHQELGLDCALMEILMEMVFQIALITAHAFPILTSAILTEMESEMLAHSTPMFQVLPPKDVQAHSSLNQPSETTTVEPAEAQLTLYPPLKPPTMTQAFAHKPSAEPSLPLNHAVDFPKLLPNQSPCIPSVTHLLPL